MDDSTRQHEYYVVASDTNTTMTYSTLILLELNEGKHEVCSQSVLGTGPVLQRLTRNIKSRQQAASRRLARALANSTSKKQTTALRPQPAKPAPSGNAAARPAKTWSWAAFLGSTRTSRQT